MRAGVRDSVRRGGRVVSVVKLNESVQQALAHVEARVGRLHFARYPGWDICSAPYVARDAKVTHGYLWRFSKGDFRCRVERYRIPRQLNLRIAHAVSRKQFARRVCALDFEALLDAGEACQAEIVEHRGNVEQLWITPELAMLG